MIKEMGAKMKKSIFVFFYTTIFPTIIFAMSVVVPTLPIPDNINNIILHRSELPFDVIQMSINPGREPGTAGWQPDRCSRFEDMVQGLAISFKNSDFIIFSKYGFFDNNQEAREAAENAIYHEDELIISTLRNGSFSGSPIGDSCFFWEMALESPRKRGGIHPLYNKGILSFSKSRYTFLIGMSSPNQQIDKLLIELLAKKVENKIFIATIMDTYRIDLTRLVSNQGILRSLQAKLDVFTKHYREGSYKPALNNINSFINELDAQRGKHVSESAYQTLRGYADTIVQSLNSLM